MLPNTTEHNIWRFPGSSLFLSRSIFPKEFEFMYKHDSKHRISSQDETLYTWSRPNCLMRYLHMWASSSCFILISNERRISHKLFAQYVCTCFSLTQTFDSIPLPMGDWRGSPRCPPPHPQQLQQSGRRVQQACQTMTGPVGPRWFCFRNDGGIA